MSLSDILRHVNTTNQAEHEATSTRLDDLLSLIDEKAQEAAKVKNQSNVDASGIEEENNLNQESDTV